MAPVKLGPFSRQEKRKETEEGKNLIDYPA
jgi:hypothetical protein